ncbi:isoleucine--tRNA ligase [candidate division KSB1 bacterium]|nr:isoleucine--tRNA ligase [candidate division KSB1 bacterium]RQW11422.1 MAG: isoleucine--tRNA ligase [candidate division KSB1 bacterium]
MKYKPIDNSKLPELEREILKFWQEDKTFERSINDRPIDNPFVFYEGPPTANGRPGIHHVIARTVKDVVCRLKTMQGYRVERKAGWDTHGLPVEIEVEKELGLDGKDQVIEYGVAEFCKKCRESVWTYKQEWDQLTERMGYWIDLDNPYITYTNDYIESVWWILKQFWEKGLIYQGFKILPYCPHCETPLSGHEVSQGYEEIKDPSIYVKAKIKNRDNTYFLVWTTTPWTLISNVALALHPDATYVKVLHKEQYLILAQARLGVLEGDYEIVESFNGSELANSDYEPFFSYVEPDKKAYYTALADFVTMSDGSGIVHIAPAFGEDDYQLGLLYDLPMIHPVDKSGKFVSAVTPWAGRFVKDADVDIIVDLKHRGLLYRTEKITHSYPHCWRCKSPLLYYARKSWYIKTTAIKEKLIANNKKIDWHPKEVGSGRFGEWLENNIDWALSRDRFWGTPLPVWRCEACQHDDCIGSTAELREKGIDVPVNLDLHKPSVDAILMKCPKCNGLMRRVPEVIDCWFDSGSMPVAQWHYPFENKDIFAKKFPADFISEGVDQTRGWFYSMLVIGTFLFDQPTFKTCLSVDMILDKEGQKMSKSKGNSVDPFQQMEKYGADILRWYLLTVSPPWLPTRYDEDGLQDVNRKFFGTLTNTYSFFAMYADIDQFEYSHAERIAPERRSQIDRWILAVLQSVSANIISNLAEYDLTKAARALADFVVDDLSNWYVRRSRRRFWKSEMGDDKRAAFQTLHECLVTVCRLMAPFAPFLSEAIYRNLTRENKHFATSVHLCDYPTTGSAPLDYADALLEERMQLVRRMVEAGRSIRNDAGLRVRQPLAKILIVDKDGRRAQLIKDMENLIIEELNVKSIQFVQDQNELLNLKAEPVYKNLGPKFGRLVNQAAEAIKSFGEREIKNILNNGGERLVVDGHEAMILPDDMIIKTEDKPGLAAATEGDLTIALATDISEELLDEGLAREFVNRVQNMRKEAGFQVTDRINIFVKASDRLAKALMNEAEYIQNETLCLGIEHGTAINGDFQKELKIDDLAALVGIAIVK